MKEKYSNLLEKNILFQGFNEKKINSFLDYCKEETWPKHTCAISSRYTCYHFFIIASGRIKVYQIDENSGREFTLFLLSTNDVFDLLCLLENKEHQVFYETLDEVILLSLPIETMREWIENNPETNKMLLLYLGKQIRNLEDYAANITLADISSRLARLILKNINHKSQKLEMINDLSNDEIANFIGSTRAVVNRHLQHFKEEGILKLGRKKMEIKNLELLIKQAENNHSKL